jgi:hypothetical protein
VKRFVDLIDIQKINRMNEVRVIADIVMQKVLLKGKKRKLILEELILDQIYMNQT